MAQASVQRVYVVVVQALEQRIADGSWQPGQRLPSIPQLARELGVSTGSVREAARVLAARGLLRIEHGRGMFVADGPAPRADLSEYFQRVETGSLLALLEARRILEPELAALAAERASDEDLAAIEGLAQEMEQAVQEGRDFVEPDIAFHQRIAGASGNIVLAGVMAGLHDLILEGRELTVALPGMTPRAVRYHLLIGEALRERRPLQARLLMLAHVNDAIDALLESRPMFGEGQRIRMSASSALVLSQRALEVT